MRVLLQACPKGRFDLKAGVETARRNKGRSFALYKRDRWVHKRHNGWVWLSRGTGGVLTAELQAKGNNFPGQILEAFIGFLMRHLRDRISSVTIALVEE